jgi:hypothetical protein
MRRPTTDGGSPDLSRVPDRFSAGAAGQVRAHRSDRLRFLTTIDPTSYGRIGAMAWATGETMPDTAPQAAFPHHSEESPPATVPRKTPRPIRRSSTIRNGRSRGGCNASAPL